MLNPAKTLVIGCDGFLGKGFLKAYQRLNPQAWGTHYKSENLSRRLDLFSPDLNPLNLRPGEYGYALIGAAHTNLALCEREKGLPFRRNVEGILQLVEGLVKLEIQPILFSTAYVFDGEEGGYTELSKTNPINEYGRQKEALEKKIEEICGANYLMIRCSKVFDLAKGKGTLIDQMCSQLIAGQRVRAAYDQVFCPLLLEDLVGAVLALQANGCKGLYNICGREKVSRLELAREIADSLKVSAELVVPISLNEVQSPFKIPKKTNMNCNKFYNAVDFETTSLSSCILTMKKLYLNEVSDDSIAIDRKATVGFHG